MNSAPKSSSEDPATPGEAAIRVRGLVKTFGRHTAVDGLDLSIARGEVFGFLGPNGSGKSTTLRMIMGLLTPTAGTVEVLGWEISGRAEELRASLGYMTQRFSLYENLSIEENLDFAGRVFGIPRRRRGERIERVLTDYGLEPRRDQRPATLSGGWKQRLALAAAVVHEPSLLVLDEPTAGVDPDSRRFFWDKIFELADDGTTILVSTHYMDEAVRCHRLAVLREGRCAAAASPDELTAHFERRVVEIRGEPIGEILRALHRRGEVLSAAQLGSKAHVLLQPGHDAGDVLQDLLQGLRRSGFDVAGEVAAPFLEDALIALSRGEEFSSAESAHGEKSRKDGRS